MIKFFSQVDERIFNRSVKISLVVGTILMIINQSDFLVTFKFTNTNLLQIVVTYFVPMYVSMISSVLQANESKS